MHRQVDEGAPLNFCALLCFWCVFQQTCAQCAGISFGCVSMARGVFPGATSNESERARDVSKVCGRARCVCPVVPFVEQANGPSCTRFSLRCWWLVHFDSPQRRGVSVVLLGDLVRYPISILVLAPNSLKQLCLAWWQRKKDTDACAVPGEIQCASFKTAFLSSQYLARRCWR